MLQLNSLADINAAIELAWESTALAVDDAMLESIVDARYTWPRGESPRDIVDTGALAESQSVTLAGDTISCEWGNSQVDYAIDVHEGNDFNPARRWTREAIKGDDTAPQQWQNPKAILDVPAHFTDRFKSVFQ
jgi:hypothetical protein